MNRRTVLQRLLQAFLAPAALEHGIVDAHVHFYDPKRPQGIPWPVVKTDPLYRTVLPGPWSSMVRPLGVTGVVVVEASPWVEDNQWVLDLAKENPVIVGFIGHLEPGKPEFRINLARFGRHPLFRGIRLGSSPLAAALHDRGATDDLRRLADGGFALDVLGSGPMLSDVALLATKIPNLHIVIDHLPFEGPIDSLRAMPQVFAKVSGVVESGNWKPLDQVWDVFGPDRVIYGSNWPVSERVAPYATVLKTFREYFESKGAAAAEKYFRKNAKSAYRLR